MTDWVTIDGNEGVARVAYQTNDVVAIYPITPSSPMAEWADRWASEGRTNLWGAIPEIVQMQSEAGVAGALHGALQAGSLVTTFTASQGLLLMIPNMFKIAGELTPFVMHVAARTVATHALSIFGDHSDVMATRSTGFALLASNSVQEAQDFALIAKVATLESRIPFLHFFDGFRTSHEVAKIRPLEDGVVRSLIDEDLRLAHRERALDPNKPVLRGTAQNPDVFFQAREACNPFYHAVPTIVEKAMERFTEATGRHYGLVTYSGDPDADRVIVLMGSAAGAVSETIEDLRTSGEKVGMLEVHLFRPWPTEAFLSALPATTRAIAVLDRTKEPGAAGEPLYQDVVTAVFQGLATGTATFPSVPRVVGGRYGLSSKEFTPAMAKAVFDELKSDTPRNGFTVGITDDVSHTSLPVDEDYTTESPDVVRAVFYGLGADGTVGANKNSIKIIGEDTENHAQGYFVYDSKKSGSTTVSHLRFGPRPIRSTYLVQRASFVACHQFRLLERMDVLHTAEEGATFLLNAPYPAAELWPHLPTRVQRHIVEKNLHVYTIDADAVAREAELGRRINTVMQACFFAISGVLPREQAIAAIKKAIKKTYGARGDIIIERNWAAVDSALAHLEEVTIPTSGVNGTPMREAVWGDVPDFVRDVTSVIIRGEGNRLPVSAFPPDGTFPTGTTRYEKRDIAPQVPVWEPDVCIQCGKCVLACPHGVIRGKLYDPSELANAPDGFKSAPSKWPDLKDLVYTLQISQEDCTGCSLCVDVCPAKNKSQVGLKAINMVPITEFPDRERDQWDFFVNLPDRARTSLDFTRVKDVQLAEPLFEFSGACAGCGETPYLKLLTQLFGDRMMVANATGCSSIFGGNLPTTPWAANSDGLGPAWSNSLFEDNAEFGFGMRIAFDHQRNYARLLLGRFADQIGPDLVEKLLPTPGNTEEEVKERRALVAELRRRLAAIDEPDARDLAQLADVLARRNVWIIGGDGWAYDIGFGGLDHVLASGRDVNVLVLDTEVYSNTGGQASKSTPRAAVAKFAAGGKPAGKKDLALLAMSYGNVYVARVAMGASDAQTVRAFVEAEAHCGPSLIIAYSHCIAHGYDMMNGMKQQKAAVDCGHWPLVRFQPSRIAEGLNPFQLDSKPPRIPLSKYVYNETRYGMLVHSHPERAAELLEGAEADIERRWQLYDYLAGLHWTAKGVPVNPSNGETAKENA